MANKAGIALDSTVVASTEQVSCDLTDEVVILSLRDGGYYGLNPVAASIWSQIQEPRTLEQVRQALLDEYAGITPEECTAQLLALIEELVELGLVEFR